jgi:iron complex transport system substrate-binding protein
MQKRILSLIPSATEIVCALGKRNDLVGISHECDFPASVTQLPRLTRPRLEPHARGSAIDRQVREIVAKGLSIYNIELKKLEKLKPDLILTQDQCHVCAVSLDQVEEAVRSLLLTETKVCSLKPHCLDDIYTDIQRVGDAIGASDKAVELVAKLRETLGRLADVPYQTRPKVVCLEWLEPSMAAGGWIPELVRISGGEPLIVTGAEMFKRVAWSAILKLKPDVVCLFPCGYPLAQTLEEIKAPELSVPIDELIKAGIHVVACDGNAYFNRPGPRIVDSAELLAGVLHPGETPYETKYAEVFNVLRSGK